MAGVTSDRAFARRRPLKTTLRAIVCTAPLALAAGCAAFPHMAVSDGARDDLTVRRGTEVPPSTGEASSRRQPDTLSIPPRAGPATPARTPATQAQIDALVPDEPVDAALAPQTIPQFAATVFGGLLNLPYTLGPEAASRSEVISGGTGGTLSKRALFRLTQQALRQYGIEIYIEGGAVTVGGSDTAVQGAELVRTREPQTGAGRVIQFFTAQSIEVNPLQALIRDLFPNLRGATVTPDQLSNTLIISGSAREVGAIVRVLREIDQPRFAGGDVLRHSPVYWQSEAFAAALEQVLTAEGFAVSRQAAARRGITILVFSSANQVLTFTDDPALLARVRYWVDTLDQPAALGDKTSTFVYEVRNTDAQSLGMLAMGQAPQSNVAQQRPVGVPGGPPATQQQQTDRGGATAGAQGAFMTGRIMVDPIGNRVLFTGTATEYAALVNLLTALDRPAPQVVVEVIIAEVTLTDSTSLGVTLFGREERGDGTLTGGTEGIEIGSGGLLMTFRGADLRADLNAQASNNRVNILQRPQLVTRSGQTARFQVGTDVPIITSQRATNVQSGDDRTDILQNVQYRQTGVILELTPVVYGDRVDIIINQEISEVGESTNSAIASPPILNRSLSTQIAIADGWTGVLGGLIANNYSKVNIGVPFLKDIPIIGSAFQNNTVRGARTELLMLITPRIIRGDDDMADLADLYAGNMNDAFRTGRGWSYTLTPFSLGPSVRGLGLDLPSALPASERPPLFSRRSTAGAPEAGADAED